MLAIKLDYVPRNDLVGRICTNFHLHMLCIASIHVTNSVIFTVFGREGAVVA